MTCEGIYADVQWKDESFKGQADEQMKGNRDRKGALMDRVKLFRLISEYKEFKRSNVQHFKFKSASSSTIFGKVSKSKFNQILLNLSGRAGINSSAGADLL